MADDDDIGVVQTSDGGYRHADVSGAINQHTPSYWRLALPALGARYVARYATELAGKHDRIYDMLAGLWMLGITSFFAYRTAKDMHNIFSEAVGYEFDKKPGNVNANDLLHSENKAMITARNNFMRKNALRTAINSTFFASRLPWKSPMKGGKPFSEVGSVDLGVGLNGASLTMEILGPGRTFFEQLQSFIDLKVNPQNSFGEKISPLELMQLYQRNAMDNDKDNLLDVKSRPEILKNSHIIFERMADLMNKTYTNKTKGDNDSFPLPKFVYLIGFNLIQPRKVKESLLYVEVANTYGIGALKEVVRDVRKGTNIDDLIEKYRVPIPDNNYHGQAVGHEITAMETRKFSENVGKGNNGYAGVVTQAANKEKREDSFVGRMKEQQVGPVLSS